MTPEEIAAAKRPFIRANIVPPVVVQPKPIIQTAQVPDNGNVLQKHKLIKRSRYMSDMLTAE